jgi:hypothetical protein
VPTEHSPPVFNTPAVEKAVFLNVPYDKEYAPLFTALIAGLVALGRIPRCALEAQNEGRARLQQIHGLLASCGSSIHDLSRVTLSGSLSVPRFNLPFELGIAFALAQGTGHRSFTMAARSSRTTATSTPQATARRTPARDSSGHTMPR